MEVPPGRAQRLQGGLQPGDVATVVGAQHVDELVGALPLVPVVGDVGAEVGGRAVGLLHGPIDLVAVEGRAEEEQVLGLADPLLVRRAGGRRRLPLLRLRRRELAPVDEVLRLELGEEAIHGPGIVELLLGAPDVEGDLDRPEVGADHLQHVGHGPVAEEVEPLALGRVEEARAELVRQRARDRDHVLAGVALRRHDHGPPEQLLVAQVDRAGQGLDLGPVVVDVVLARDGVAAPVEQPGHRVAGDGAPAVPDVHGAGGVGRDELDVDPLPLPHVAPAEARPLPLHLRQPGEPDLRAQLEVDESGAGDFHRLDGPTAVLRPEELDDALGELARRPAGRLGEDHRRVHREVAVAGVARRIDAEGGFQRGPAAFRGAPGERPPHDVDDVLTHGGRVIPAPAAAGKRGTAQP